MRAHQSANDNKQRCVTISFRNEVYISAAKLGDKFTIAKIPR